MKNLYLILLGALVGIGQLSAQAPANDACTGAIDLGTMPTPNACDGSPQEGQGNSVTTTGDNTNATAETPYSTIIGCQSGNDMASPAADVWYSVVATGTNLNITVTGLTNPNIGLYEQAGAPACDNLNPRGCDEGPSPLSSTFTQITAGNTYYIQISGGDLLDVGSFDLEVSSSTDCGLCMQSSSLTVSPTPSNGFYQPGTTVSFCYTVEGYDQLNTNWIHGVAPIFGTNWDQTTLNVTSLPATCDGGTGEWQWFTNIATPSDGNVNGFFFDGDLIQEPIPDGDPTNNYGDNCGTDGVWEFCFDITTAASCPPGTHNGSLNIEFLNYADGETGNWTNLGCITDPDYVFSAALMCCDPPIVSTTDALCFGEATGTADITGSGIAPHDYTWYDINGNVIFTDTDNPGTSSMNNLAAGTYTVDVIDDTGCPQTISFTINEPTLLTHTLNSTDATCGATDGTITLTASGGTPAYTFDIGSGAQANGNFTNLGAGNYPITIIDANGCTINDNVTINASSGPSITNVTSTDITCFGADDGTITVTSTGGAPTVMYDIGGAAQTSNSFTGLTARTYTITVTDGAGCSTTSTATIAEPTQITFTTTTTDPNCGVNDGEIVVNASGGSGIYTYSLDGGAYQASNTFSSLGSGTYTISVLDDSGCEVNNTASLNNNAAPNIDNVNFTEPTCSGSNDGQIIITASGGSGALQYSIETPVNYGPTNTFTNVGPGTYTISVQDPSGCVATSSVTLTEPDPIDVTLTPTNLSCYQNNSGVIDVSAIGGDGNYTYQLDGGAFGASTSFTGLASGSHTVVVQDGNGCTGTAIVNLTEPDNLTLALAGFDASCFESCDGQAIVIPSGGTVSSTYQYNWIPGNFTGASYDNICAGTYTITVNDDNGCSAVDQIVIDEPTAILTTLSSTPADCGQATGTVSSTVSGGTPNYTYSWVDDSSNPVGNTANVIDLTPGWYYLLVTDANSCTKLDSVEVQDTPGPVATITDSSDVLCFGDCNGTATGEVTGGSGVYLYEWFYNTPAPIGQNALTAVNLCPGVYNFVATDDAGCITSASVTINEPQELTVTTSNDTTVCIGTCADISASALGGTGAYTYTWNYDIVSFLNGANQNVCPTASTNYSIEVEDANGCLANDQVIVSLNPPITVQVSVLGPNAICPGDSVIINAIASGGDGGPYTYSWQPAGIVPDPTITDFPTTNTTYIVTASDDCGSPPNSDSLDITLNPLPIINFTANQDGCYAHTANFVDNTSPTPIFYQWDFGDSNDSQGSNSASPSHTYDLPGTYSVSLTAQSPDGCVDSATFDNFITVYDHPIADFEPNKNETSIFQPEICFTDQSFDAMQWYWNFGGDIDSTSGPNPCYTFGDTGCYNIELIVANQYGCLDTTDHDVCVTPEFALFVPNAFSPNGDGDNDFFFVKGIGIDEDQFQLWIFDRWGNMIYDTDNLHNYWNGKVEGGASDEVAQIDTYVWKIKLVDYNGISHVRYGHVSIIK